MSNKAILALEVPLFAFFMYITCKEKTLCEKGLFFLRIHLYVVLLVVP